MQKRRPDKEDTQEIKLPKSKDDYGDNFENSCINEEEQTKNKEKSFKINKIDKKKLIILISSIVAVLVIVIIIVCIAISNSSLEQNSQSTTSPTSSTKKAPTTVPTTTSNYTYTEETEITTTIVKETTTEETDEPTTTIFTTEPVTTVQEESSVTESLVTTEEETTVEKNLSVSDILILKTDDGLFVPKITGNFVGYTPDELLNEVTVTTSSGTPKLSLPYIDGDNSFTFNMDLEDCTGEIHIHIDNYDFYQSIDSFPE